MAMGDDELKVPLGFDLNTSNVEQGMQRISALTSQIREDFRLISEAVEGVTDKADRMRDYFQGNVDIITSMKSLLEAIQSINQANQTTIGNNITLISELLNSVKGLNGDITHAMQLVSQASGAMQGVGGAVNIGNTSTSSQNFAGLTHHERRVEPVQPLDNEYLSNYREVEPGNPISQPYTQAVQSGAGGGGGGNKPPRPPIYGAGSGGANNPNGGSFFNRFFGRGRNRPTRQPSGSITNPGFNDDEDNYVAEPKPVSKTPAQILMQNYLRDNASNLYETLGPTSPIPLGGEHKAAEYAYANMLRQMKTAANILPGNIGNQLVGHAQSLLSNYGNATGIGPINMDSIRQAQKQNTSYIKDSSGNIMYDEYPDANGVMQKVPRVERTGAYTPVEQAAIQIANTVARVMNSPIGQYGTQAAGALGMASNLYGMAKSVTGYIGQYAQNAQAQAQAFGTVSYARSAGNYLQALEESGFGLNPLISTQQVQQMQIQGATLGLRGSNLSNFVEQAVQNQEKYGMSGAASQSLANTALGAGISINDIMGANAQVRQLEANTQTSTTYGSMALATGAMGAATMGAGSQAAATMGVQAARFGAGDFIAQAYGMTGQEGTGTMINNAMMAQALGTSYMGLFAAERNAKGSNLARAQNKSDEQILSYAGIDVTAQYKNKNDFLNKNQNQIMELSTLLQDPQWGSKLNNIGSSPQASADWAWNVVQQHQKFKAADNANKAQQQQGFFRHLWSDVSHPLLSKIDQGIAVGKAAATDIGHDVRNVVNAPGSLLGNVVHGFNYGVEFAKATTDAITQGHDINITSVGRAANADNRAWDNTIGRYIQPLSTQNTNAIATSVHNAWNAAYANMTGPNTFQDGRMAPTQVEINLHPDAKKLITTAVKASTAGFNNGIVPPNKQPTR